MTSFDKHALRSSCRHSARKRKPRQGKTTYKHVPHSEKPPHLVARRNARERRRVETVNNAFLRLRRHVPTDTKHKRLSKVKTLRNAIDYIKRLTDMIDDYDKQFGSPCCNHGRSVAMVTVSGQQQNTRTLYHSQVINTEINSCSNWYQHRWRNLISSTRTEDIIFRGVDARRRVYPTSTFVHTCNSDVHYVTLSATTNNQLLLSVR